MTNMPEFGYLIIGNSAGGIGAAEAIRSVDRTTPITIISGEPYPAYSRPLIADYLAGKKTLEKMLFRPDDFYRRNNINTILGAIVETIDTKNYTTHLADGRVITWRKLLLATGGLPISPPIPGKEGPGVFTFTTLDDARAIRKYIKTGMRAVIIGGGLIGISVTEALVVCGIKVTIIEMKDRILNTIIDKTASTIVTEALEKNDVKIITDHTVSEINREFTTDRIYSVTLNDSRPIPCDMVVIAIGVSPRTELAVGAGLKVNRGIVVDRTMQTSHPDVYACGDVAEAFDFIYGENRVTPIWPNAYAGGRIAGLNMAGVTTVYAGGTTMNSIKYFGLSICSAGMFDPPDSSYEVISQQTNQQYRKVILNNGLLAGLIYSGKIEQSGIVYGLMKDRVDVSSFKRTLISDDFGFMSLPETLWRKRLATSFKIQPEETGAILTEVR